MPRSYTHCHIRSTHDVVFGSLGAESSKTRDRQTAPTGNPRILGGPQSPDTPESHLYGPRCYYTPPPPPPPEVINLLHFESSAHLSLVSDFPIFLAIIVQTLVCGNIDILLITAPVWVVTFLVSLLVTRRLARRTIGVCTQLA